MSPPDDTPPAARLARWSEWWFTPRWRALLTWLALTAIAINFAKARWVEEMVERPIVYLNLFLPASLPWVSTHLAKVSTALLLFTWFEPLALRLSLRCGLVWIGLSHAIVLITESSLIFLSVSMAFAIMVGIGALQCGALHGWRSRPWMCLPARASTVALAMLIYGSPFLSRYGSPFLLSFLSEIRPRPWLAAAIVVFPSAALLLYGTRLLRPEERARGTTGQ